MDKELAQIEVNKKNTAAVKAAIEDLVIKLQDQQQLTQRLQTAIAALTERVVALEVKLNLTQARMTGTGPTVK